MFNSSELLLYSCRLITKDHCVVCVCVGGGGVFVLCSGNKNYLPLCSGKRYFLFCKLLFSVFDQLVFVLRSGSKMTLLNDLEF